MLKRLLLALALFTLGLAQPAGAAITVVGHTTGQGISTALTPPLNTVGATQLTVTVYAQTTLANSTLTDTLGNTFTGHTVSVGAGFLNLNTFICDNPITGTADVFNFGPTSGGTSNATIGVIALAGTSNPSYETLQGISSPSTVSSITVPSYTPLQNNEAVVVIGGNTDNGSFSTISINSGVTVLDNAVPVAGVSFGLVQGILIQTTAAAISPTLTYVTGSNYLPAGTVFITQGGGGGGSSGQGGGLASIGVGH